MAFTLPMDRLFEATMRGNAEMQAQQQVKKVAGEQMDANKKVSVTIKPNPTGGPPLITMKDAPADLLNGTQDKDVAEAYSAPKRNVENALSGAQRVESGLRSFGFMPKSSEVASSDIDSFGERYRARRELGGSVIKSAVMAGVTRGMRDKQLRENVANQRAAQNSATFQKFVSPVLDQELQAEGADLEAGRLESNRAQERRLAGQMYLNERNRLLDQQNVIKFGTLDEFMGAAEGFMKGVGGMREEDRPAFERAWKTGRVSFLSDRRAKLSGEEGKLAIQSYGDSPEEIERFVDEQVGLDTLTPFERQQFRRTAKGLIDYRTTQEKKEAIAEEQAAARQRAEIRATQASLRAAESSERAARSEERAVDREDRRESRRRADEILNSIDRNNQEIIKNNRDFAKGELTPAEKTLLQDRNRALIANNTALQAELPKHGVTLKTKLPERPPTPPPVEYVTQAEYDAMIAKGMTADQIKSENIRVRK